MRFVKIVALVGVLGWVDAAGAGEQYVDQTGFAISGHDVIAYYELDQAPVGEKQPQAVPGRKDITAEYNGVTWAFTSEKNRQMFVADPENTFRRMTAIAPMASHKAGRCRATRISGVSWAANSI